MSTTCGTISRSSSPWHAKAVSLPGGMIPSLCVSLRRMRPNDVLPSFLFPHESVPVIFARPLLKPHRMRWVRALALPAIGAFAAHVAAFGFDDVARRAAELSARPYHAPAAMPKALQELTYDQYRDIRFKPAKAIWRGTNL